MKTIADAMKSQEKRWTLKAVKDFGTKEVNEGFVDIQGAVTDALDSYYKLSAALKEINMITSVDLVSAPEGTKEAADLAAYNAQALAAIKPVGTNLVSMLSYLMSLGY